MSNMELNHFSHEHPLVFADEAGKEGGEEVVCYGCKKSISGSAYRCGECDYFLHQKCAELPVEIQYPMHTEHALTLYETPPYSSKSCECNVCLNEAGWEGFTYNCKICEFDVDILCVLNEGTIEHEGHQHPLTFLSTKAIFACHACGTKGEEEQSYLCTKCLFWIHKSCALSPTTITHSDHDHPLALGFSLPYENRSFEYFCEICKEKMHPSLWLYYCDKCRYFLHIKCANTTRVFKGDIITDDPETIIRFPLSADELINLFSRVLNEVSLVGEEINEAEINHFSHAHSLSLLDELQSRSISTDEEIVICDCCIQPITTSTHEYYGCIECSYFLHKSCTNLPLELKHPCHPDHLLQLYAPKSFIHNFQCNSCQRYGNGFYYCCKTCDYYLDINCAYFPNIIKHEGHEHPMHISQGGDDSTICDACGFGNCSKSKFVCDGCEYRVGISCAGFPGPTIWHDWVDPLILSYPPYSDHPGFFICEICEEEMHPKRWAYRSPCGLQFFHLYCVIPYDYHSKTKFGGTLTVENHPHPLTYVLKCKNKSPSPCDICGKESKGWLIAECATCNFVIHRKCCLPLLLSKKPASG